MSESKTNCIPTLARDQSSWVRLVVGRSDGYRNHIRLSAPRETLVPASQAGTDRDSTSHRPATTSS